MTGWWRYRSPLLAAAALIAVAAVLVAPSTRWIAWRQMQLEAPHRPLPGPAGWSEFGLLPRGSDEGSLRAVAARHPGDADMQIAVTADYPPPTGPNGLTPDARLRALLARFPGSPLLYATILQRSSERIRLGSREPAGMFPPALAKPTPPPPPRYQEVSEIISDAEAGERSDPNNAYFPFIRAMALIAVSHDSAGTEALRVAATRPIWRDYAADRGRERLLLCENAFGEPGALTREIITSVHGSMTYGHYRSFARVVVGLAAQAEVSGRIGDAFAIRQSLMRCMALMREQSTTSIGALVAIAIFDISMSAPHKASVGSPPQGLSVEQRKQRHVDRYCAKLLNAGRGDDARWVQAEYSAERSSVAIMRRALGTDSTVAGLQRLAGWWCAGLVVLANVIWILLLGLVAAQVARRGSNREAGPLAAPVRWGIALAVGGILVVAAGLVGDLLAFGGTYGNADAAAQVVPPYVRIAFAVVSALAAGAVAWRRRGAGAGLATVAAVAVSAALVPSPAVAVGAAYAAAALAVGGRPRSLAVTPIAVALIACAVTVGCLTVLAFAASWQVGGATREYSIVMTSLSDMPLYQAAADFCMAAIAPLAVPMLLVGALSLAGWRRRVPVSVALVRGFRSAAIPTASLLLIVWAVVVLRTVPLEAAERTAIDLQLAHEGRYYAAQLGEAWPGHVR